MHLPSADIADIDEPDSFHIVWAAQSNPAASIVAFKRSRDLNCSTTGLSFVIGWLRYLHADGTVLSSLNCPGPKLISRDLALMTRSQAYLAAAEFLHLVDGVTTAMSSDDHPPLVPRDSTVLFSDLSPVSPVVMDRTSSPSLEILTKHRVGPVYSYLSTGYSGPICCHLPWRRWRSPLPTLP